MRKLTVVFVFLASTVGFSTAAKDRYIKAGYIASNMVGISCKNGGDPTVVGNYGGVLIVSCGTK